MKRRSGWRYPSSLPAWSRSHASVLCIAALWASGLAASWLGVSEFVFVEGCLFECAAFAQVQPAHEVESPSEPPLDPRGVLWVDYNCKSEVNQRRVSLFASGTLRLRTEGIEETQVRLAELAPFELTGFVNRLGAEDLSETDRETWSPGGDWIERCRLDLTLPERPAESFVIDRFGSVSLALSRVLAIVKEMDRLIEERSPPSRHLPAEYRPMSGDILERVDGARFQVVGYTMDKLGVELVGLELPLTVFIHFDDVRKQFVALLSRRER